LKTCNLPCITVTEFLVPGSVQSGPAAQASAMVHRRSRTASAGARAGGDLHKPSGVFQPPGPRGGSINRAGRSSSATSYWQGQEPFRSLATVAEFAGTAVRNHGRLCGPSPFQLEPDADCRSRSSRVFRGQWNADLARPSQKEILKASLDRFLGKPESEA
jgi:hypothetical protein